jgi:PEP-CTERM motif-containing protein
MTMLRWIPLLGLLLLLVVTARADSITIGQLQYLGTENGVSAFKVVINTAGFTLQRLPIASLSLSVNAATQQVNHVTAPLTALFTGGPGRSLPNCPCNTIVLTLTFLSAQQSLTVNLADGRTFTTQSTQMFNLHAPPGQDLKAGDSTPLTLVSVPEPAALFLMGTGFLAISRKFAARLGAT